MSRVHAKKTASPKRRTAKASGQGSPSAGVLWLLAGLLLGLFILGLVYLHHHKKTSQDTPPAVKKVLKKPAQPSTQTAAAVKTGPQLDFYTLLPEMQVGEANAAVQSRKSIPASKTSPSTHQYILQAGAFKRHADADKVRANLILQGFNVQIKVVVIKGVTWQRIIIGPYNNLADAQQAQATLDKMAIKSLLSQLV